MEIELIVRLVIPDNVAITTFHTLKRMGYKLEKLERADYYKFKVENNVDKFMKEIGKVDILVNANKNKFIVKKATESFGNDSVKVLVKSIENDAKALLSILRDRLGFKTIKSMEKGTLWTIKPDNKELAEKITKELLINLHYQKFEIL